MLEFVNLPLIQIRCQVLCSINLTFINYNYLRALVGAILEKNGSKLKVLVKLKEILNPLTTIKLRLKEIELPNKSKWYFEWTSITIYRFTEMQLGLLSSKWICNPNMLRKTIGSPMSYLVYNLYLNSTYSTIK